VPEAAQVNGWYVLRHTAVSEWLSKGLSLAKTAAYLRDTKEVVLSVYAYFMPSGDNLAREIMNGFFSRRDSGENARRMTSAAPAGLLWLLDGLLPHFSM
jgi:hypothetical protein